MKLKSKSCSPLVLESALIIAPCQAKQRLFKDVTGYSPHVHSWEVAALVMSGNLTGSLVLLDKGL